MERNRVNITYATIIAPGAGRIQHRIANVGEVLPLGAKVFTMLDMSSLYMDIYLPVADAGKVRIGTDARIVLDAMPNLSIPAKVSFVAAESQITPSEVESKSPRESPSVSVRVLIDRARLDADAGSVRTGLPGVAYIRLDPKAAWPP